MFAIHRVLYRSQSKIKTKYNALASTAPLDDDDIDEDDDDNDTTSDRLSASARTKPLPSVQQNDVTLCLFLCLLSL
jgi:hypothetical protein